MNESKELQVGTEEVTEKVQGESGQASAISLNETKSLTKEEAIETVYAGQSGGEIQVEEKKLGSQQKFAGKYLGNQKQVEGFERSAGEKNIVNTITVEETKKLIKLSSGQLRAYIDSVIKTIREGQYVKVDTEVYPTLESFLASTGEQGTVYLYPLNNSGNYDQYIWETGAWISLGSTQLDLSNYVDLTSAQTISGTKTFSGDIILANNTGIKDILNRWIWYYDQGNGVIKTQKPIYPVNNNSYDIGSSSLKWRDIHLAGAIKDLPTITQAEYDAMQSGGTLDSDTFYFIKEE